VGWGAWAPVGGPLAAGVRERVHAFEITREGDELCSRGFGEYMLEIRPRALHAVFSMHFWVRGAGWEIDALIE
jgi:hypothetical protein